jgi:hypothetical protein
MAYNELSAGPLLSRGQVDPVADHGGVLVAKVVGHALGADGALGLDVVCNRTTNSSRLPDVYLGTCQKFQFGYFLEGLGMENVGIFWPYGILYGHWYIISRFGMWCFGARLSVFS